MKSQKHIRPQTNIKVDKYEENNEGSKHNVKSIK